MMICIGGISGTGKSSIISKLVLKMKSDGYNVEMVRGLPIMCKLAGGISEDDFRRLPDIERAKFRPAMQEVIYGEDKKDPETIRIWDGHFAFFGLDGIGYSIRKVRNEDFEQMKLLVVVDATPESVLERRIKDGTKRLDRIKDLDIIKRQLKIEEEVAGRQAKELKIPVIISNNNGTIENAVNMLSEEIKKSLKLDGVNFEIKRFLK